MFLDAYHAVFTGNRNGGAPHLQGREERKHTLLSSCRMRQTTAKTVIFFLLMRLYGAGATASVFPVRTFPLVRAIPKKGQARRARRANGQQQSR